MLLKEVCLGEPHMHPSCPTKTKAIGWRIGEGARVGILVGVIFGAAAPARSAVGLATWADQRIKISGSSNVFCGLAHSNGAVDVGGHDNAVRGPFEFVSSFKASSHNTLQPVQVKPTPAPQPPR